MNLSGRERKLLIALGAVVVLLAIWFVFLRPSSEPVVLPDDLFAPQPSPTAVQTGGADGGAAAPTVFTIPPGARNPFAKG